MLGWFGHFGMLMPLAIAGMIATWPDRRRLSIVYALALAYAASVVMFFVFARYRYPLVPFLILFAAAPFDSRARDVRREHVRSGFASRTAGGSLSIAVAIFCN